MTNKAVELKTSAEVPTLAKMDSLIEWVVQAPVEEVCWRVTELGSMRQWLKAQKEATELRIKAVRLELIALRKVAAGGLAHKISGAATLRASAKWLAGLTDDEFGTVLAELDGERTPIALYQSDRAQREAMEAQLRGRDRGHNVREYAGWDRRRDQWESEGLLNAVETVLESVIEEGQPFTVSQAAQRLAEKLELDTEVISDTAEGLREMVRSAIRKSNARSGRGEVWDLIPAVFTFEQPDGTFIRVPAKSATIGHLVRHEQMMRDQAIALMERSEKLRDARDYILSEVASELGVSFEDLGYELAGSGSIDMGGAEAQAFDIPLSKILA